VVRTTRLQRQLLKHVLRNSVGLSAGELLFDPVTYAPGHCRCSCDKSSRQCGSRKGVGILTVNFARFQNSRTSSAGKLFDGIVRGVAQRLLEVKEDSLRKEDALGGAHTQREHLHS